WPRWCRWGRRSRFQRDREVVTEITDEISEGALLDGRVPAAGELAPRDAVDGCGAGDRANSCCGPPSWSLPSDSP
ncbi:MAG: hypothetical protein ACPHRO_09285, partial [Nannocystaceae bacterium]